ncbi:MAG: hypothetical protein PUG16_04560 [Lachnospiraceae bacterium]|nr:hypothetical protein [Lachnospiraceae bacterium]
MRKSLQRLFALGLALVTAAGLSGCSVFGRRVYFSTGPGLTNVFCIGNLACGQKEARVYLLTDKNLYGNLGSENLIDSSFDSDRLDEHLKYEALSQMSYVYALNLYAREQKISLDSQEEGRVSQAAEAYYKSLSKEEKAYLKTEQKDLEGIYGRLALAEKVYTGLMSHVDDEVSEDEARVLDMEVILVTDKDSAETVQNSLSTGSQFEILSQYNQGKSFKVEMKRGDYPAAVEKKAFQMENDETAEVEVNGRWYFLKCLSKYNEELSAQNKEKIVSERQTKAMTSIIEKLDQNEYSELNKRVWKSVEIPKGKKLSSSGFFDNLNNYLSFT